MGQVHNALRRSPLASAVLAVLGAAREPDVDIERVSETIYPCIDPTRYPDSLIRAHWMLAQASRTAAAAAGLMSICQLFNPVGSNRIATVTRVDVSSDVIAGLLMQTTVTQKAGGTSGSARDRRWPPAPGSAGVTRLLAVGDNTGAALTGVATIWAARALANVNVIYDQPIILVPGSGIDLSTGVVLQLCTASFTWIEREALPGELE